MIKRKDYNTLIDIKNVILDKYNYKSSKRITFIVTDEELLMLKACTKILERRLSVMKKILDLFGTESYQED